MTRLPHFYISSDGDLCTKREGDQYGSVAYSRVATPTEGKPVEYWPLRIPVWELLTLLEHARNRGHGEAQDAMRTALGL